MVIHCHELEYTNPCVTIYFISAVEYNSSILWVKLKRLRATTILYSNAVKSESVVIQNTSNLLDLEMAIQNVERRFVKF